MRSIILLKNTLQPIFNVLHITTQSIYFATIGKLVFAGNSSEQITDFVKFPMTTDLGNLSHSLHYTLGELSEIAFEVSKEVLHTVVSESGFSVVHSVCAFWEWVFRLPLFAWKALSILHTLLLTLPGIKILYITLLVVGGASLMFNFPAFFHLVLRGLKQGFTNFWSFFSFVVVSITQIQKATLFKFLSSLKENFLLYLSENWPNVFAFLKKILTFFHSVNDSVKNALTNLRNWLVEQVESLFNFLEYLFLGAKDVQGFLNQLKSMFASMKQWSVIRKGLKEKSCLNSQELRVFNEYRLKLFQSNLDTVDDSVVLETLKELTDHQILELLDKKLSFKKMSELVKENRHLLEQKNALFTQKNRLDEIVEHLTNCFNLSSLSREFVRENKVRNLSISEERFNTQRELIQHLAIQNEKLWAPHHQDSDFTRAVQERTIVLEYLNRTHELVKELLFTDPNSGDLAEHLIEFHRITKVLEKCNENLERKFDGVSPVGYLFPYECHFKTFSVTNTLDRILTKNPSLNFKIQELSINYPKPFPNGSVPKFFSSVKERAALYEQKAAFGAGGFGASGSGTSGSGASGSGASGSDMMAQAGPLLRSTLRRSFSLFP